MRVRIRTSLRVEHSVEKAKFKSEKKWHFDFNFNVDFNFDFDFNDFNFISALWLKTKN